MTEPAQELPVTECPCFTHCWCGDSRIEHFGLRHHTRCDGHGDHRDIPHAVEVDGDGWCVCEMHQRWKREVAALAASHIRRGWSLS